MKPSFIILFCPFLFLSCNAVKKPTAVDGQKTETVQTQCPGRGECSWELLSGKSLVVKKDGTGRLYPELVENAETSVVKFRYHRDSPEGISDGQYTEEVYFEVQNDVEELSLQDQELQKVKLLYGRMCFCERGTVGYFEVGEGTLDYSKNKDGAATISLVFQNNRVPQRIGNLQGKVVFK